MNPLLALSVAAILLGIILGWSAKGSFCRLLWRCTVATFVLGAIFNLVMAGPPDSINLRYMATALVYFIYPYLVLLLLPSVVAGGLTMLATRRRNL
jgi:hypothetical protein